MAERLFRNSKFEFVGSLQEGKKLVSDEKMGTGKWFKKKLNLGVKNDGNMQFLNMEYIYDSTSDETNLLDKEGKTFKVKVSETTSQENMNKAGDFTKVTIDLETDFEKKKEYTKLIYKRLNHLIKPEEERTEEDNKKIKEYTEQINELMTNRVQFCCMNDVINFLEKAFPIIKNKKIKVTGTIRNNVYNGKNNFQYNPSMIEIVPDETPNQLSAYLDVFYTDESLEDDMSNKKIIINGYVGERVKKVDTLFPQTFVIDYSKIDMENEQHKLLFEYLKSTFKINDAKKVHKMGVEVSIINGSEVVEFNEDCLTEQQKLQVKLGFHDVEYFRPKGNIYGEKKRELKVITGDFREYPEGSIIVFDKSELYDYTYKEQSDVTEDSVKKDATKEQYTKEENSDTKSQEELMRSLFN